VSIGALDPKMRLSRHDGLTLDEISGQAKGGPAPDHDAPCPAVPAAGNK
jgi:hypothetical protein